MSDIIPGRHYVVVHKTRGLLVFKVKSLSDKNGLHIELYHGRGNTGFTLIDSFVKILETSEIKIEIKNLQEKYPQEFI